MHFTSTWLPQEVMMEVIDRWHAWPAWAKHFLQR